MYFPAQITQLWYCAWPAGLTMVVLGGAFAVVLLIASERLKVQQDPTVARILEVLPGLDCGACGYAGCRQYAKAVAENPELIGQCAPGGQETTEAVAGILNLQVSASGPASRPVVHCRAHTGDKTYYADYAGIRSCIAADLMPNFQACAFGCLGFGDCVSACRFDALQIIDGLATVDYDRCTGCGRCVEACPRGLIEMVGFVQADMLVVACSSRENAKATRQMCKVGCIGCGLCEKQSDVFSISRNLARVDYERYRPSDKTETAYHKCPTGVIVYRGRSAAQPRQPARDKARL